MDLKYIGVSPRRYESCRLRRAVVFFFGFDRSQIIPLNLREDKEPGPRQCVSFSNIRNYLKKKRKKGYLPKTLFFPLRHLCVYKANLVRKTLPLLDIADRYFCCARLPVAWFFFNLIGGKYVKRSSKMFSGLLLSNKYY